MQFLKFCFIYIIKHGIIVMNTIMYLIVEEEIEVTRVHFRIAWMGSLSGLVLTPSLPLWPDTTGMIFCYLNYIISFLFICWRGHTYADSLHCLFAGLMEMGEWTSVPFCYINYATLIHFCVFFFVYLLNINFMNLQHDSWSAHQRRKGYICLPFCEDFTS